MDEVIKKPKPKKFSSPMDRVTLTQASGQKLLGWIDQLNEKYKGLIDVNKSDLVNHFLSELPELLNREQVDKIKKIYYDEVRFMQWALQKMKESKKSGEDLSLKDLMQLSEMKSANDVKRPKKSKSTESTELVLQNETNESLKSISEPSVPLVSKS